MAVRLASLLPRVSVLVAVLLGASATLTFAAAGTLVSAPSVPAAAPAESAGPTTMTVPEVRGQAFVFAKGMLEDGGFAWKVSQAGAPGYLANLVVAESPAPGVKVIDTGAPTITLTLARNAHYRQSGDPENAAPFDGTALELAAPERTATPTKPAAKPKAAQEQAPAAKKTTVAPAKKTTVAPAKKTAAVPAKKPAARAKPAAKYPQNRPPAFSVPGATKEPLDEMPLPDRARLLGTWLGAHPKPTNANVRHWLYQHAWVVTGAKFGWWHGAAALKILIADDRRAERAWGIGNRSEVIARAALAEVEARSR